jgi:hypothetical protein
MANALQLVHPVKDEQPHSIFSAHVAGFSAALHRTMLLWELASHTKLSVAPLFASLGGHDPLALKQTETTNNPHIAVMVPKLLGCRMLCKYAYPSSLNVGDQP